MSKDLDAAADGAFSGKLADPADTLTKRGGKGVVRFEGREYTRLEWVRRTAAMGGTLAAGEGALLEAELACYERALRLAASDIQTQCRSTIEEVIHAYLDEAKPS
jgi:hypothetical protein